MKKSKVFRIIIAAVLLIPTLGYALSARTNKPVNTNIEKAGFSKKKAYAQIGGFSFTKYVSGKRRITINTEEVTIRPKRIGFLNTPLVKEAHMLRPEIIFFKDDKEISRIRADSGKMNMSNMKIILKKDVKALTRDGKKLTSGDMALDSKRGLLTIRGKFTLDENGNVTRGSGLKSDIELKDINIKKTSAC